MNSRKSRRMLVPAIALGAILSMGFAKAAWSEEGPPLGTKIASFFGGLVADPEDTGDRSGKSRVIGIHEGYVSDRDVAIERGTAVLFRNYTDKTVHINFMTDGAYDASIVPPGGTASLQLTDLGTYNYAVVSPGGHGGEGQEAPIGMIAVVKSLAYAQPETVWFQVDAGFSMIPGQIEPPFDMSWSRGWGAPLKTGPRRGANPGPWAFDYPLFRLFDRSSKQVAKK